MAPGPLAQAVKTQAEAAGHPNGDSSLTNGYNAKKEQPQQQQPSPPTTPPSGPSFASPPFSSPSTSTSILDSATSSINTLPDGHGLRLRKASTLPLGNGIARHVQHAEAAMDIHSSEASGPQPRFRAKTKNSSYTDNSQQFPRISRPVELLRPEYDVVVIGSGYGGGVAASRMARGKQSVCVLELGKERWPGEYPSTTLEALANLHVTGDFDPLDARTLLLKKDPNPTGLYHLVLGQGQNAFVANGLGGTSLLNANVFLRVDPKTQALSPWPKELRKPESLEPYYKRAEFMLQPASYPKGYPRLAKLDLLEKQAKALNLEKNFYRVPQTTRFENGPNNVGVEMQASSLTGMDCTGVNDGSKSSTLVNYLSDAWNWGAEIFCETEVRYILPCETGGYNIFFAWHGAQRGAFKKYLYDDLMWVHAKKLCFLGAGTLGTTEILLRSRDMGLSMSSNVGKEMSGNGDILAFGYNTKDDANAMGRERPDPDRPIGPTIAGIIDCRDQENPLDGFVIEEGAVPQALADFYQTMLETLPGRISPKNLSLSDGIKRKLAAIKSRVLGPYHPQGSTQRTQVYLIMSHDSNQAVMTLKDNRPVLKFLGVGRSDHVLRLNDILAKATEEVGGTFVNSPFYAAMNQEEITVHPIGGACLSVDGTGKKGVTTHYGELLKGDGTDFHDGLVICDGAVVPTALGVNPFATITALAERSVEGVAIKKGIVTDYDTRNGLLDLFGQPAYPYIWPEGSAREAQSVIQAAVSDKTSGVEFTEVMRGPIHPSKEYQDFSTAAKAGLANGQIAQLYTTAHAWDIDTLVSNSGHHAILTGTFTHPSLPGSPYMILQGSFQLLNDDGRTPDTRNLTYDFDLLGKDRSKLHFHGFKSVTPSVYGSAKATWKAASTLKVRLTNMDGGIVAQGTLHIDSMDFKTELSTFRARGPTIFHRLFTTSRFINFFARRMLNSFLGPLGSLQYPNATYHGYQRKRNPTRTFRDGDGEVIACDGVESSMQFWDAAEGIEKRSTRVLFIPGAATDHQVFALPTIKENAVEFFTNQGYPVYCVTPRVGRTIKAQSGWTSYDARFDIEAALIKIRKHQHSKNKIYVICHGAGSIAFASGLLDKTIPAEWIKGVTASNVFFNPIFSNMNKLKARLPVSFPTLYSKLAGSWLSCSSSTDESLVQRVIDQALRFYPVGSRKELCNSVVCHRSELAFGRLWTHHNLNNATHSQLSRFIGGVSMKSLQHSIAAGIKGDAITNLPDQTSLVNAHNLANLRGIPICFISGSDNAVYSPESTSKSYATLQGLFGPALYRRKVFEKRGDLDCWMSQGAKYDVWEYVLDHLNECDEGAFDDDQE